MAHMVEVPTELFTKFLRATCALDEFHDALEDYLIANNPPLLRKLRKARREHLASKTRPIEQFQKELLAPRQRR